MQKRVFAVFAHNEQRNIRQCLESIQAQCESDIYVLINGCTDNTQSIVEEYAKDNPNVKPVLIELGDKANAWNVFVYDLNVEADNYFFLDGDCRLADNAVDIIEKKLCEVTPNVVAATPDDMTRSRRRTTKVMLESGGLAGNLYVITGQFMNRLRARSIRVPIGVIWEDGFIAALAYWDLEPFSAWELKNILVLEDANFTYTPLSIFSLTDLKLYYRRKIRYSRGFFQNKVIAECYRNGGVEGLEPSCETLFRKYPEKLKLSFRGINSYFDYIALKEIRSTISNG